MHTSAPSPRRFVPGSTRPALLALLLLAPLAAPAPARARAFELKNVYVSSFQTGGSSAQTLRCQDPGPDGSAACELLAADGKVLARGTLKRQGKATGDRAAETKLLAETFRNPATRVTTRARGRELELRIAAPGEPILIALLLPAVQMAREAPRRTPTATGGGDLVAPPAPERSGRVYTPAKGPNTLTAPQTQTLLTFRQLSTSAVVPMKPGRCPGVVDCGVYVLANRHGNTAARVRMGIDCVPGKTAFYLGYRIGGGSVETVLTGGSTQGTYTRDLELELFSASELETACQKALGGSWPEPGGPRNTSSTVATQVSKTLRLWGRCYADPDDTSKDVLVKLALTCTTQNTVHPVP